MDDIGTKITSAVSTLILNNPLSILIIMVVFILLYWYFTSDYKFKMPHLFAYNSDLRSQVLYWTENFSEDIMNLYKIGVSDLSVEDIQLVLGQSFQKDILNQLKQKVDAVFHDDINILKDVSDMEEKLQDKLTWVFVTIHDDENIYERNAQSRYALFDLIIFVSNNFANLKIQHQLFYSDYEYEDNIKYFVKKAKDKYNKNINISPSLQKNEIKIDYLTDGSIIPYDSSFFETIFDIISYNEGDGELPQKIDNTIIHEEYKSLFHMIINKVIDQIDDSMLKKNDESFVQKTMNQFNKEIYDDLSRNELLIKYNDEILNSFFETNESFFKNYFYDLSARYRKDTEITNFLSRNFVNYITKNTLFEKKNKYEFEKLLFDFKSEYGRGLLMKDFSFIEDVMQKYHKITNLYLFNKHHSVVRKAYTFLKSGKNSTDIKNAFTSLYRLHISLSDQFPKLLYYDTKHSVDKGRLNLYYNNIFKSIFDKISFYIKEFLEGLPQLFTKQKINLHKKYDNFILTSLIDLIQKARDYFTWIRKNLSTYIKDTINSALEGYKDHEISDILEKFVNDKEEFRDISGNVVEPFVSTLIKGIGKSIAKPFMIVISAFKLIFGILKLITNPVAIIRLLVSVFIMFVVIVLSFVDIIKIVTGTFALVVILTYMIVAVVYLLYYLIIMQILRLFDISIFQGKAYKIVYEYLIANEKDIRNWFMTPSYEQGNENHRLLIVPFSSCPEGYKPGIFFCERISKFVPTYSYHANIHRQSEGMSVEGSPFMKEFVPESNFHKYPENKKKRIIMRANLEKEQYLKKMNKRLSLYQDYTKATCFTIDNIDGLSSDLKNSMKQFCNNLYCQNGNFETFCGVYNNTSNSYNDYDLIETYIHLTSYILVLIAIITIIIVSFYDKQVIYFPKQISNIFYPLKRILHQI